MKPMLQMSTAAQWLPGARLVGDGAISAMRVHTDTRSVEPGDPFLALKGEKFDANTMLHEACKQGAAGLICHAGLAAESYPAGVPRIEVADISGTSICPLARVMRRELRARGVEHLKVVYSKEIPLEVEAAGNPCLDSCDYDCPKRDSSWSSPRPAPGSISYVTAVFGFIIAAEVVKDLLAQPE